LYIDPLTGTYFRDSIKKISSKKQHTLGLLHLISNCDEFFPKFSLRQKDYAEASVLIENNSEQLIEPISEYDCSRSLLAIKAWINEHTEINLSEKLGIESGDMHRMAETANWLCYCLREISKNAERADLLEEISNLRQRIVYGIKEELLDLVKIKGIGRVRARKLFKHGIENLDDLRKIPVNKLAEIDKIGIIIADNIKTELKKVRY
jgi:helicase